MNHSQSQNKRNSFRKIWFNLSLVAVLSVILPILVLGIWFYSSWKNSQTESFILQNINKVRHISLTVQQNFDMIDNDILLMKTNSDFYDFKKMILPGEHVKELQVISNRLTDICTKYAFVQSAYFYDTRSQSFITNTFGTYPYDQFYDRSWLDALDSNYQICRLPLRVNADAEILREPKRSHLLMYTPEHVITVAGSGVNAIKLAINISATGLYNYLNQIYLFDDFRFTLVNGSGTIVAAANAASIGEPFGIDLTKQKDGMLVENGQLLFINPMENNQLLCVLSYPANVMNHSYSYFKSYIFSMCLLITIIVVLIAVYVSKQIYSPVTELFQSIENLSLFGRNQDETEIQDDISYIKSLYHDMENDRNMMKHTLNIYERALRNSSFKNYLDGLISYEKMTSVLLPTYLDFENAYYQFVLFHVPSAFSAEADDTSRIHVTEMMDTYIAKIAQGLFFNTEKNIFMAVIAVKNEAELAPIAQMILRLLGEILEVPVFAGQSEVLHAPQELIDGYAQAAHYCSHATFFGIDDVILNVTQIEAVSKFDYSFVINFEMLIIKNMLCYNQEKAMQCMRDVRMQVTMDMHFVRSVYLRLLTTLDKELGLSSIFDYNLFERFYHCETLRQIEDFLCGLIAEATAYLEQNRESQSCYCTQAKTYLEEHYDQDISVCELSDQLGISYPYLSKLFKTATNMGLLDYLNMIRVEKSKEHLLHTNDNLCAVAEKVGYNNSQSYQRFFKKRVGMTPGEYRKANGHE